ncbi:hypothetical protein [Fusibacter sp. JL216-2]|uniref:hypothetical protein n=1 Tax=Fusibacter sp. JL216-2 TaxID=3071453 RepID=UPI003D35140F
MWGNFQEARHYGNLRKTWGCAVAMLALLLSGVLFINFDPVVYNLLVDKYGNLILIADTIVIIGVLLMAIEVRECYKTYQHGKKVHEAKKIRHEYRKHLQNVQALLYVEAYDEVTDYTLSLENDLKAI